MDRNGKFVLQSPAKEAVALRKESVDRNIKREISLIRPYASLSARRAWIEMICRCKYAGHIYVALRKESVDRNTGPEGQGTFRCASLSARRAWIEIFDVERLPEPSTRRSPQGERG